MSKILITGATGQLGGIIIEHLLKTVAASDLAVLVRDESKATDLKQKGLSIKIGDYHNNDALIAAMQGIDKVLLISSSDFNGRFQQHKNVIDAASAAGVKHIFYTGVSMRDVKISPIRPLLEDHFMTEDYIKEKGLTYTFLQNSLYFEVIPMFAGEHVLEMGLVFPAGAGKVSFASRNDLGEAIAKILGSEGHENKTYTLSSRNAYSFSDIASNLSTLTGNNIVYTDMEAQAFETMLSSLGLPPAIVSMSALFAAAIKHQDFEDCDSTLESILGRPQMDLNAFLKSNYNLWLQFKS